MPVLEKIGKGIGKVKDKTSAAIDTTVIKGKINEENGNIERRKIEIGELYWKAHSEKKEVNEEKVKKLFKSIDNSMEKIADYEQEIADLKEQ
jgi:hypothetical protein